MRMTLASLTREFIEESGWSKAEAPKFAKWYLLVDSLVEAKIGMDLRSIGDWDYATAYEERRAPKSVAKEVASAYLSGEL